MSIKINVGVSKKIGLPDYGSAGGMCNVEIEADNVVLSDPEQFLNRVRDAFDVARVAVEEELAHHRPGASAGTQRTGQSHRESEPEPKREYRREYRNDAPSSGGGYTASPKQLNYIISLMRTVKVDKRKLEKYCDARFGKSSTQLSPKEASALIDVLKEGGKEVMAL